MWLIDTETLRFKEFHECPAKTYAILSHTWRAAGEEVTFDEFKDGKGRDKPGFEKIKLCCEQAKSEGLQYAWIDTCCIDKRSSTELSEAINSMFMWYQQSQICYAYLADISYNEPLDPLSSAISAEVLKRSRWFGRGWTLQELIAPDSLTFYSQEWIEIGTKSDLAENIHLITKIDIDVLKLQKHFLDCSIAQRMSWASRRQTTRLEDTAYCLIGLFNVNLPMMYGEGSKAFHRLQMEIIAHSNDETIFAWTGVSEAGSSLLAPSPANFAESANIQRGGGKRNRPHYVDTNKGLQIECELLPYEMNTYKMALQCHSLRAEFQQDQIAIFICRTLNDEQYRRVNYQGKSIDVVFDEEFAKAQIRRVFVPFGQRGLQLAPRGGLPVLHIQADHSIYHLQRDGLDLQTGFGVIGRLTPYEVNKYSLSQDDLEKGVVFTSQLSNRWTGTPIHYFQVGFDFDFRPIAIARQSLPMNYSFPFAPLLRSWLRRYSVFHYTLLALSSSVWTNTKVERGARYVIQDCTFSSEEANDQRQWYKILVQIALRTPSVSLKNSWTIGPRFEGLTLDPCPFFYGPFNRCSNVTASIHPSGDLNWVLKLERKQGHSDLWFRNDMMCSGCIARVFLQIWYAIPICFSSVGVLIILLFLIWLMSKGLASLIQRSDDDRTYYTFAVMVIPGFILSPVLISCIQYIKRIKNEQEIVV